MPRPRNNNMTPPPESLPSGLPASDFRSPDRDRKRDMESKRKWKPKWAAGLKVIKEGPNGTLRPRPQGRSQRSSAYVAQMRHDMVYRNHVEKKRPILNDDSSASQDSSADEDVPFDDDATQVGNVDIKYSYDAARGPAEGVEIFGLAVTKAVEKYEDEQTSKLVNDEYEILDVASEADDHPSYTLADDDDGFELV